MDIFDENKRQFTIYSSLPRAIKIREVGKSEKSGGNRDEKRCRIGRKMTVEMEVITPTEKQRAKVRTPSMEIRKSRVN